MQQHFHKRFISIRESESSIVSYERTKLCRAFYYSSKKIKHENMCNTNIKKNHVAKFKNICVGIDTILELKTFGHAGNSYNDVNQESYSRT